MSKQDIKIKAIVRNKEDMIAFPGKKDSDSYSIFIDRDGKSSFWGFMPKNITDAIKEFYTQEIEKQRLHWHSCSIVLRNDFRESEKIREVIEQHNLELHKKIAFFQKLESSVAIIRFGKSISVEKLKEIKWPKYAIDFWTTGIKIVFYDDEIYKIQKEQILRLIKNL